MRWQVVVCNFVLSPVSQLNISFAPYIFSLSLSSSCFFNEQKKSSEQAAATKEARESRERKKKLTLICGDRNYTSIGLNFLKLARDEIAQ
jgi:hypothetical protein